MDRRTFFVTTSTLVITGSAGCSSGGTSGGSMSWEEAFNNEMSSEDESILKPTPITVDEVSTRAEVKTALNVLGWNVSAHATSSTFLNDLETFIETASELQNHLETASQQLSRGLELVNEMKETSTLGTSVWDVATKAAPSLEQFVDLARSLRTELNDLSDRLGKIKTSTSDVLTHYTSIRSSEVTEYGEIHQSFNNAISEYETISRDLNNIKEDIDTIRSISAEARDIAGEIPVLGEEISAVYSSIFDTFTTLGESIGAIRQRMDEIIAGLTETQEKALAEANQRYRPISEQATGSSQEMDAPVVTVSVDPYHKE